MNTNLDPPGLGPTQPVYPPLLQLLRVTAATVAGPPGFAQAFGSSVLGPMLYVAFVQQLRSDGSLLPRDREPCLADDVRGLGLTPGFYLGRLAGTWTSLPVYEVIGGSGTPGPPGPGTIRYGNVTDVYSDENLGSSLGGLGPFGSASWFLTEGQSIFLSRTAQNWQPGPWIAHDFPNSWQRPPWFTGTMPNGQIIMSGREIGTLSARDYLVWDVFAYNTPDQPIFVNTDHLVIHTRDDTDATLTLTAGTNITFTPPSPFTGPPGTLDIATVTTPTFGGINLTPTTPAPSTSPGFFYYNSVTNNFVFYGASGIPVCPCPGGGAGIKLLSKTGTVTGITAVTLGTISGANGILGVVGVANTTFGGDGVDLIVDITDIFGTIVTNIVLLPNTVNLAPSEAKLDGSFNYGGGQLAGAIKSITFRVKATTGGTTTYDVEVSYTN